MSGEFYRRRTLERREYDGFRRTLMSDWWDDSVVFLGEDDRLEEEMVVFRNGFGVPVSPIVAAVSPVMSVSPLAIAARTASAVYDRVLLPLGGNRQKGTFDLCECLPWEFDTRLMCSNRGGSEVRVLKKEAVEGKGTRLTQDNFHYDSVLADVVFQNYYGCYFIRVYNWVLNLALDELGTAHPSECRNAACA